MSPPRLQSECPLECEPNMRKLFGTDGVRGTANLEPMTSETAMQLGRAAAHIFMTSSGSGCLSGPFRSAGRVGRDPAPPHGRAERSTDHNVRLPDGGRGHPSPSP